MTTSAAGPTRLRRMSAWLLGIVAASTPVVGGVMWFCRRWSLEAGLPCQARGPYDCGYDADLAAVYGAVAGLAFTIVTGAAFLLGRRFPLLGAALAAAGVAAWTVVAFFLVRATMT
jgi:hypothetical protein